MMAPAFYLTGAREGAVAGGGGGASTIRIVGGTGRFAQLKGTRPCEAAYLKGKPNGTTAM